MQPLTSWLVRHRSLSIALILCFGIVLILLFIYHIVGIGRDDLYTTKPIEGTELYYSAPRVLHNEEKLYTIYVFFGPTATTFPATVVSASPGTTTTTASPIGTATISATPVPVTIVNTDGVILVPKQPVRFNVSSDAPHTVPITIVNRLSAPSNARRSTSSSHLFFTFSPCLFHTRLPYITLDVGGATERLQFGCEDGWQTFLRRLVYQPLVSNVLTILIPIPLAIISAIVLFETSRPAEQLATVRSTTTKLLRTSLDSDMRRRFEKQLENELYILRNKRALSPDQQGQYDLYESIRTEVYPLLQILRSWSPSSDSSVTSERNNIVAKIKAIDEKTVKAIQSSDHHELALFVKDAKKFSHEVPSNDKKHYSFDRDIVFLNERLILLAVMGLFDRIELDDVEAILSLSDAKQMQLDPQLKEQLRRRVSLGVRELRQPAERRFLTKLIPLEVTPISLLPENIIQLEPENQFIVVTGKSGSGKTTLLERLQQGASNQRALYLPVTTAQALQNDTIDKFFSLIEQAVIALMKVNSWFKPQWVEQPAQSKLSAIVQISDELRRSKIEYLCLAIDDAPEDFNYSLLHQQLQECIHQQIFIRVAFAQKPSYPVLHSSYDIEWLPSHLEELYRAIDIRYEAWRLVWPEVEPRELWERGLVKTPRDMLIWRYLLQQYYHGDDVTGERLNTLQEKMEQARKNRSSDASDWQLQDAREVLASRSAS